MEYRNDGILALSVFHPIEKIRLDFEHKRLISVNPPKYKRRNFVRRIFFM
jgi:hypothetical protein